MGIFDGLAGSFNPKGFASSLSRTVTNTVTERLQNGANSIVQDALSYALGGVNIGGVPGGTVNGKPGLSSELAYAKNILEMAMRIQYAQGWQFVVEADGLGDLFMFVRDVTYSAGTVETEAKIIGGVQFNKPTYISAGTVTLTVRDSQDGKIANWFDERQSRVINKDGTINLSPFYVLNIRIYRVGFDGSKTLDRQMTVFPTERGATTRAYDQAGEFLSYALTFVSDSSADTGLGGMAKSAAAGVLGSASNSISNIIKF